jgi:hypothetical protein
MNGPNWRARSVSGSEKNRSGDPDSTARPRSRNSTGVAASRAASAWILPWTGILAGASTGAISLDG